MGYHGRFYLPALPFLLYAAWEGWPALARRDRRSTALLLGALSVAAALAYLAGWVETHRLGTHQALPAPVWLAFGGLCAAALLASPRYRSALVPVAAVVVGLALYPPTSGFAPADDASILRRHGRTYTTVRGLFDLRRCLPHLRTLYHTEMGIPGLLFPEAKVVDLAGLLSRLRIESAADFDALCARDRPEAIFLPHKAYADLRRRVERSRCLQGYVQVVDQSSSPLTVRRDLAEQFLACAREPHVTGRSVRSARRSAGP